MENAFATVLVVAVCLVLVALVWGTGAAFKALLFGCLIVVALALFFGGDKPDS
jgi:hypothetical protein